MIFMHSRLSLFPHLATSQSKGAPSKDSGFKIAAELALVPGKGKHSTSAVKRKPGWIPPIELAVTFGTS